MPDTLLPPTRQFSAPGRWFARAGHWLHRSLTRENLIQSLKTLASVVPLTILIWIYAEREGIRPEPDVSIVIEVRSSDPHRVVTLKKPYPDKTVVANLEGPPATLAAVVDRLARHSGDEPAVEIFVGPKYETGQVAELDTAAELAKNPMFRGIAIRDCQPPKLDVYVDELVERDLEVQAPANITNLLGPPVFTPRTVKVRGPKESIDELFSQDPGKNKLVAVADLASLDGINVPGPHDFPVVRIKPLDKPDLTFSPSNVDAVLSVRESDVPGTILSVPIWVTGPPDVMAKNKVVLTDPVLHNVKVRGPSDKIAMVNQPDFLPKPHAVLEIHEEDEAGKPLQRTVQFELPLGLRVDDEISAHPIDFRLVDVGPARGNE